MQIKSFPNGQFFTIKPKNFTNNPDRERCCSAINCVIYYTLLTPIRRNPMFKFEDQYKKFEEVLDRTQAMYDFWTKAVFTAAKDLFKVK
jgi:hypothetical protein